MAQQIDTPYATSTPHPAPPAYRVSGFPWEVHTSDGKCRGFERKADADRFCREHPAPAEQVA